VAELGCGVVAHPEGVGQAIEPRVVGEQGAVHLLRGGFLQDRGIGDVLVAVVSIPQMRDHGPGHIRGACAHRPCRGNLDIFELGVAQPKLIYALICTISIDIAGD